MQSFKEKNTQGKYLPVFNILSRDTAENWAAGTIKLFSWVLMSGSEPSILYVCLGMYFPSWMIFCLSKMIYFI